MSVWKKEADDRRAEDDFLNVGITELNLSVRSYNCLKRAGCDTIGDILALISDDENGLRRIRNLGSTSEKEILKAVETLRAACKHFPCPDRTGSVKKDILIRPGKRLWDLSVETFCLSDRSKRQLRQNGIRQVKDLYAVSDPKQEPGWYAVRELLDKILLAAGI